VAIYKVKGPDGNTYQLEGPEGASEQDILSAAEELLGSRTAAPQAPAEQPEEEYEGFLQEVGEGIVSGLIAIPQGIVELGTSLVDVVFDTDYTQSVTDFANYVRDAGGIDPTGAAGEIAEVITQFAIPGLGAASMVSKAKVLAEAPKLVKAMAQIGAAGVTDAVVATDGVTTLGDFFQGGPTQTTDLIGLEGREKAMARLGNRLKLFAEASGATATVGAGLKALGATTDVVVKGATPIAAPAARQALRAGTYLSTKAKTGLENLVGPERVDQVLSVFRSRGYLTQEAFEQKAKIAGNIESEMTRAGGVAKQLQDELDTAYKDVESVMVGSTPLTRAELNNRLYGFLTKDDAFMKEAEEQGLKALDMLPKFLHPSARRMRLQVDRLSKQITNSGFLKTAAEKDEVMGLIKQNIGSYLRRKYKIFEDAGYMKTAEFQAGRQDVIEMLEKRPEFAAKIYDRLERFRNRIPATEDAPFKEEFMSQFVTGVGRDARVSAEVATDLTDRFVKTLTDRNVRVAGSKKGGRVAVNKLQTAMFRDRTLSDPTFKRMLGEINDSTNAYITTVADLATFSATDDFLTYMAKQAGGEGDILTEAAAKSMDRGVLESSYTKLDADYWGAMKDMYVSNRVYNQLTRQVIGDVNPMADLGLALYSGFLRAKGATQFAKTVLSPITQVRNVTSASLFALAQGNVGAGANLFESVDTVMRGVLKRPDKYKYYSRLQRLGVINTQSELREIDRLMTEGLGIKQEADRFIAGVPVGDKVEGLFKKGSIGKFLTGAKSAYQAGDDVWKIYNFEFERNKLISAYGSVANAEKALGRNLDDYAADIVKNTVPNYERVPEFVKSLRKLPVGNFIAFPAEILRTSANTLSQALKELSSQDKVLQQIGMRRLTGFLGTTMVAPMALQGTAMMLSGVDSEQMDAVRRSAAPWARNHTLLPTSTDEKGNVTGYVDYSYTNPYDYLTAPVQAIFNAVKDGRDLGKDPESVAFDAVMGSVGELFAPFFGESIITEKMLDVTTRGGVTQTGAKVYREVDDPGTKIYKSFTHIADAFMPGAADLLFELKPQKKATQMPGFEAGRLFRSFTNNNVDPAGNERKAVSEFMRMMTGVTEVEVNPENIVMYSSYNYSDNSSGAKQIFNTAVRTKGVLDPADAIDTYRSANDALYRTQSEMYQVVQDMRKLGKSDSEIRRALKRYKISNIGQLMRGKFVPMDISSEVRKDVRQNGNTLPTPELNAIKNEYRNKPLGGVEPESEDQTSAPLTLAPTSGPTLSTTSGSMLAPTSGPTLSTTGGPVLSSSAQATTAPSAALMGSNPADILKNMQIAQRTR